MRLLFALLAALSLSAAPARAQETADDLAVIIANKSYKHAAEVKFALRDAEAFAKAATEALRVPRSRVRPILRDLTSYELKRLFAKDGEIAGLMRGRRPTARLIVFYSGHGVPVDGRGHLLPVDAPPGAAGDAAYDIEQMKSDLIAIKPERGQVLVFLDACFSGQTGTGAPLVPGSSKGPINITAMSAKRKDVVVVAAAQRAEVAWWDEAPDRQHGLFTDTLIDGLYGLASEDGKALTVAGLERFLVQRMSERLAVVRPGHTQTPDVAALDRTMVITTYPRGPGVRDVTLAALEKRQCQLLQGETDPERIEAFTERECRICACRPALRDLARELRRRQAETAAACAAEQKLWPSYRSGDAARIELFLKAATCPAVIAEAKAALAAKSAPAPPKASEPAPLPKVSDTAPKVAAIDPKRPAAGSDPALAVVPGSGKSFRDKLKDGRDCPFCPEMVVVPAGSFLMGSPAGEQGRSDSEGPQRTVTIRQAFAVGKFEVTFGEWDACVSAGGCTHRPSDQGWGRGRRPVINVSWEDAKQYVAWLSKATGKGYRLLTEAEWEYAARAKSTTRYHFGDSESGLGQHAWYGANSSSQTQPVGQKTANSWGLHDMHGNAWEWVEDCWHGSYSGAPSDGSVWTTGCTENSRVLRGGSWSGNPQNLRSAFRFRYLPFYRTDSSGFRLARTVGP